MSTELKAELTRLEAPWASIGHPLADPQIRPPGRPAAETQRAAVELLGHELPTELVELWEWWGGLLAEKTRNIASDTTSPASFGPTNAVA